MSNCTNEERILKESTLDGKTRDIQKRLAVIIFTYFIVKKGYNKKEVRLPEIIPEIHGSKKGCTFRISEIERIVKERDMDDLRRAVTATSTADSITIFRKRPKENSSKQGLMDYLQDAKTREKIYSLVIREYGEYIIKTERDSPFMKDVA